MTNNEAHVQIVTMRNGQEIGHETWFAGVEGARAYAASCQKAADRNAAGMTWKTELQGITFEVRENDGLGYAKVSL